MYKLLIVDDEVRIRSGLRAMIENRSQTGFQILDAKDGKEGMDVIRTHSPHIVITDIKMPDMDGLEMIETISQTVKNVPIFLILSGYDNFNYAKKAMKYGVKEYLLKPVKREELFEALDRSVQYLKEENKKHEIEIDKKIENNQSRYILTENYLNSLIENHYINEVEIKNQLASVDIDFKANLFRVILVEYKHKAKGFKEGFDDLDIFSIKNVAQEVIGTVIENFWVFINAQKKLVVLINEDSLGSLDDTIRKIHNKLRDSLKKYLNIEIFTGVGNPVMGVKNITQSNINANKVIKYKILDRNEGIHFYIEGKSLQSSENVSLLNPVLFESLAGEVELCNKSNIINLVDKFFIEMDFQNKDIFKLEDFYSKFCTYIYHYFVSKSPDFYSYFEVNDNSFLEFDTFWNIGQISIYLKRYLIKICEYITVMKSGNPSTKIVERIIKYVNENYSKDINLNTISDNFGKNNSYLSVLFKKETGKNFIDFLIHVRIQKAKSLLEQTDMKISDIAGNVGYSNEKYFFMAFKKVVGISPQQYRKSII